MPPSRSQRPELLRLLELLSPVDRRVLAQAWAAAGTEPPALLAAMTDPDRMAALLARLTDAEQAVLSRVLADGGTTPIAIVQRLFGVVREPGNFAHPRAYLDALQGPPTPTERLYNLGLIFRFHDERGAIYRIPNDLLPLLPVVPPRDRVLQVAPITTPQMAESQQPDVENAISVLLDLAYRDQLQVLDDGALNKASLTRIARDLPESDPGSIRREAEWPLVALARSIAVEAGLLRRTSDNALRPTAQALDWLQLSRSDRTRRLLDGWCGSTIDELTLLCSLRWKGGAPYTLNRTATRRNLLELFGSLPSETWLPIASIVTEIHRVEPDFQRRDGRYDTWLLYNDRDELVSGWEQWDRVEGALIRVVLTLLLPWLGLADVADDGSAIRLNPSGAHLLGDAPQPVEPPPTSLIVQSTFEVLCPPGASLYARFQLGRIAEREAGGEMPRYRLTRRALLRAVERGIAVQDVVRFLGEYAAGPLPSAVSYTLHEWAGQSDQVRIEESVLLSTANPVVLAQLQQSKALDLHEAEQLSPTSLRLPPGAAGDLVARLRRDGWGVRDDRIDPNLPLSDHDLRAVVTAATVYARICAELGLPTEVSLAMVQRLRRLVPPRAAAAADHTADTLIATLQSRLRPPNDET